MIKHVTLLVMILILVFTICGVVAAADNETNNVTAGENDSSTAPTVSADPKGGTYDDPVDVTLSTGSNWKPDVTPIQWNPQYFGYVRLWVYDHNPIYNQTAPVEWHELTDDEFTFMGEDKTQNASYVRYDNPPLLPGKTVWGLVHQELKFVMWMLFIPDQGLEMGKLTQVGETAKDMYNSSLNPAQNDAAGNIDWFIVNGTWYPRTFSTRQAYAGQQWTELWGPFDPMNSSVFRERNYMVTRVPVTFEGKTYNGYKYTITGISEQSADLIATEAYTWIEPFGFMYERWIDFTTVANPSTPGLPPNTMIFLHRAFMQTYSHTPPTIYYTLDGTDPTTLSSIYTGPIKISGTILKYMAIDAQGFQSPIYSEEYNIINTASAASETGKTIEMQKTGIPIVGLILAVLMLFGSFFSVRRK